MQETAKTALSITYIHGISATGEGGKKNMVNAFIQKAARAPQGQSTFIQKAARAPQGQLTLFCFPPIVVVIGIGFQIAIFLSFECLLNVCIRCGNSCYVGYCILFFDGTF